MEPTRSGEHPSREVERAERTGATCSSEVLPAVLAMMAIRFLVFVLLMLRLAAKVHVQQVKATAQPKAFHER